MDGMVGGCCVAGLMVFRRKGQTNNWKPRNYSNEMNYVAEYIYLGIQRWSGGAGAAQSLALWTMRWWAAGLFGSFAISTIKVLHP